MLDFLSRGALVAMSAVCVAGAITITPTSARSSSPPTFLRDSSNDAERAATPVASVPVQRDPFAAEGGATPPPRVVVAAPLTPVVPIANPQAAWGGDTGLPVLPGNLPNDSVPQLPGGGGAGSGAHVSAIVTGTHPYAMVELGGTHEIKGIGDLVGGTAIVGIDIGGLTLANGQRINVAPEAAR